MSGSEAGLGLNEALRRPRALEMTVPSRTAMYKPAMAQNLWIRLQVTGQMAG